MISKWLEENRDKHIDNIVENEFNYIMEELIKENGEIKESHYKRDIKDSAYVFVDYKINYNSRVSAIELIYALRNKFGLETGDELTLNITTI